MKRELKKEAILRVALISDVTANHVQNVVISLSGTQRNHARLLQKILFDVRAHNFTCKVNDFKENESGYGKTSLGSAE